nr:MAG TPA: hypothetical protein [Caudoviricetes sp.]
MYYCLSTVNSVEVYLLEPYNFLLRRSMLYHYIYVQISSLVILH